MSSYECVESYHSADAGQRQCELPQRRRIDTAAMQIGNEIGHRDI